MARQIIASRVVSFGGCTSAAPQCCREAAKLRRRAGHVLMMERWGQKWARKCPDVAEDWQLIVPCVG